MDPRTTHDYAAPGTYQAKLIIVGPADCRAEYTHTINVAACGPGIRGCKDPNALNYNPNATVDDGSCKYTPDDDEGEGQGCGCCCGCGCLVVILIILIILGILIL